MLTVVQEMGRLAEVPTPTIDVVLPLIQLRQYMADNPAKDH
jgi:2-dehydropantoate 2-reductase